MRSLVCSHCFAPFSISHVGRAPKYCSRLCKSYAENAVRAARSQQHSTRPCQDPRPGDVIRTGNLFRFVARIETARKVTPFAGFPWTETQVVFRNWFAGEPVSNQEFEVDLTGWQRWCLDRNRDFVTKIEHVVERKERAA